ncbi:MAG: hypothetical protein AAGG81_08535, partial [Chlamydiota bacterium]
GSFFLPNPKLWITISINTFFYMKIYPDNHSINFSKDLSCDGSVLAITNCGGGGHIEATKAVQAQFLEQQKAFNSKRSPLKGQFKTVDIFRGSFPPLINKLFAFSMTYHWNKAKREGNIEAQELLYNSKTMGIANSILVEWILFIPVFISMFSRLAFNKKITHIVITQPLGISAIIKASRLVNYLFNRTIRTSLVLTDLPTDGTSHYSRPIKRLSDNDKNFLKLITTKPLIIENGEKEQDWWKRVFGLRYNSEDQNQSQVLYREFPLRPAFIKWKDIPAKQRPEKLKIKINNSDEQKLLNDLLRGDIQQKQEKTNSKKVISLKIDPIKEFVGLVTIGSQAAKKTKNYVEDFINVAKTSPNSRKYTLFAACGRHDPGLKTLFRDVYDLCSKVKLPSNVRVIPMGFQDDDELAPIMHRMNFGVESAGGLTCFEFNRTAKSKIFVHSELEDINGKVKRFSAKGLELDEEQRKLLMGFSLWEKWNALYQVYDKNAEIVTPGAYFKKKLRETINP